MPFGDNPGSDYHGNDPSDLGGCMAIVLSMVFIAVCLSILLIAAGVW